MSAAAGRFGAVMTQLGQWRRMAVAGLAALFFASACGQDGADLTTTAPTATSTGHSGLAPSSTFRPLGGPRAPSASACTRAAGYWQDHPAAWWHRELQMGVTTYSKEEQLGILEPIGGRQRPGRAGPAADRRAPEHRRRCAGHGPGRDRSSRPTCLIGPQVIPPARRRLAARRRHRDRRRDAGRVQRGPHRPRRLLVDHRRARVCTRLWRASMTAAGRKASGPWSSTSSCCA